MAFFGQKYKEWSLTATLFYSHMNEEIDSCERLPYIDLSKRGTYHQTQYFLIDKLYRNMSNKAAGCDNKVEYDSMQ